MITRLLRLSSLLLIIAICSVVLREQTAAQLGSDIGRPDRTVLAPPADAAGGNTRSLGADYVSAATEAPAPFTHMLLRWQATLPDHESLALQVRASGDGSVWTEWGPVPENPDLWQEEDGPETFWSQAIYAGDDARFWQVRAISTPAADGTLPVLRQVEVNTVDARFGEGRQRASVELEANSAGEVTSAVATPVPVVPTAPPIAPAQPQALPAEGTFAEAPELPPEAAPAEAAPAEPAPAEPAPIESAPVEAAPAEPAPAEPAPIEAAPAEPAPIEAAPAEPAPIEATPTEPAPVEPAPAESAPVEAAPVEPAPVESAPAEEVPVEAAPTEVAPATAVPSPEPPIADPQPGGDTRAVVDPGDGGVASGPGKPGVVSRTGWGSPDGQGSRVKPVYYGVNHLVVHHTADSNSLTGKEQNWGDRVRAEWAFHTYSRGWGDVGYNYLIAPNGTIYEGRAGGDDAIAFHDTGNAGSMGVVLIGTYANVQPKAAAIDSLVELLAWKAGQKSINPLGRSYYHGCALSKYCYPFNAGAVVANIAGHRQVTPGHTSCPGDSALNLIPSIRNRVSERLAGGGGEGGGGSVPDNGDLVIDERESSFARSPASWYEANCGYDGRTFYTYTTDNEAESSNSAAWRPNIPSSGRYRVYAHIPQGCAVGSASNQATYRIHSADGDVQRQVSQSSGGEWLDLGSYTFNAGSDGAVELYDLTGEPFGAQRVLFFDSMKWELEAAGSTNVELLNVAYERTSLPSGELLKVRFSIRNTGTNTVRGQEPQSDRNADGSFNPASGYVYDENECYLGDGSGGYPAFPKETDRFRVTLGALGQAPPCSGSTGGYPWRWGTNGDLAPGEEREIIGYVRFRTPGTWKLQAGVVQENVRYYAQSIALTDISVTAERAAPSVAAYNELLQPLAHVYRLGEIPDNLLNRTGNASSLPQGQYLGSIPWDGNTLNWGIGGPFGQSDSFMIEQTRIFQVAVAGVYTFRTTSDDGSWLWVDGAPVVVNSGMHPEQERTGTIRLEAGSHVLAFKYFERSDGASAGYGIRAPGSGGFTAPNDGVGGGAPHFGGTFTAVPNLTLAASDGGGSGVVRISYSWDGEQWGDSPGALLRLGRLANGSYILRYRATDTAGNTGATQELHFTVNTDLPIYQTWLPQMVR